MRIALIVAALAILAGPAIAADPPDEIARIKARLAQLEQAERIRKDNAIAYGMWMGAGNISTGIGRYDMAVPKYTSP